jgi:hypothetical protein
MTDQASTKKRTFWGGRVLSCSNGHPSTHTDSEQILRSPCQPRPWWVFGIWGHERCANEQGGDDWVIVWLRHGNSKWCDVEVSYITTTESYLPPAPEPRYCRFWPWWCKWLVMCDTYLRR